MSTAAAHFLRIARNAATARIGNLWVVDCPGRLAYLSAWVTLAACVIYATSIFFGSLDNIALPTTALMQWSDVARFIAQRDYAIAYYWLMLVCVIVPAAWLSQSFGRCMEDPAERFAFNFISRYGIPIALCLFIFSLSGAWAGIPRDGDSNASSIAGLVSFSDAHDYVASAMDQIKDGVWNPISLRRPLAAAFRSVIFIVSGLSIANMLLLQTIIACLATCVATRSVMAWRGVWAGLAFFFISFLFYRSFFTTALTEPLALVFGMLAVPFFITALRNSSSPHAILGLVLFAVGLLMRMGAMFVVPALVAWIALQYGTTWIGRLQVAALAVACTVLVATLGWGVGRLYGAGPDISGSNFAHTLCGLSIGDVWSGCQARYAHLIAGADERRTAEILYTQAFKNILEHPSVILIRLLDGGARFVAFLPNILFRGYLWNPMPIWFSRALLVAVAMVGIGWLTWRRRERGELSFWLAIGAATVLSSMFVYYDAGMRVMCMSYPLLALLLASGFVVPRPVEYYRISRRSLLKAGYVVLGVTVVMFIAVPGIAFAMLRSSRAIPNAISNTHIVLGGRAFSGFLIVPDIEERRGDVPTIRLGDFSAIIRQSNLESYQGLLNPRTPNLPFGFGTAPRAEPGVQSGNQYIVPPEVLIRGDVKAWRFNVAPWPSPGGASYWLLVTKAEALK